MLEKFIKYYANVSDMAIENLKKEKTFQFRKHLTNHSMLKVVESHYAKITNSEEAKKMVSDYMLAMNKMYVKAKADYNKVLATLKATNDPITKQQILDSYCERGIHGFTAKNGAKWNIETYSNMYTTHVNNELVRLSVLENVVKGGRVQITKSLKPCNVCIPYEGKILTLEQLEEARSNGLFHVRCQHFAVEVD